MLDPLTRSLEHYMDLLASRQRLVASNIANADTPGYRTKDIDFASEMRAAMDGDQTPGYGGFQPRVEDVKGLAVKNDGNNVSLDREARMLAENSMRFNIATAMIKGDLRSMRMAIMEGREG